MKRKEDKLDVDNLILLKKMYVILTSKIFEDKIPYITNLATNTTLNAETNEVKNEVSNNKLAKTATFNAKTNGVKNKISNITDLATATSLTAIEFKMPDHSKSITTPEFNRLTAENFSARLAQENLESQNDIYNFVKKDKLDDKLRNLN